VTLHTPHLNHLKGLLRQVHEQTGIVFQVHPNDNQWEAHITVDVLQQLYVALRNQYIWVSAIPGGYSVQVDRQSYNNLVAARPDCAGIVVKALQLQQIYNKKTFQAPAPMYGHNTSTVYTVPVFGLDGTLMAYQQVFGLDGTLTAYQRVPEFA
jgi:hypothetical protein